MKCTQCGAEILTTNEAQRYRYKKTGRIFCTRKCGMIYREAQRTTEWAPKKKAAEVPPVFCTVCGAPADLMGHRFSQWQKTGRAYCGASCSKEYRRAISSATMAATNRKHASKRMTERNPMHRPETREKVRATLVAIGHKPKIQGGNGKPLSAAEAMLVTLFGGIGFVSQLAIKTNRAPGNPRGYPASYKPDLGNAALKIAIEADGNSHGMVTRKAQDAKKEACLAGLGWKVLRFTNDEILTNPDRVVETVLSTILKLKTSTPTLQTE